MLLSPRRCSTLGDLLRLVAVWLAVVLLLQGFAAVHARVAGPTHQHRGTAAPTGLLAHRHQHDEAQRHHHIAGDTSVLPAADAAALDDALDAAAEALAAAFVLLAFVSGLVGYGTPSRFWRPATGWPALSRAVDPLLKPPRR